MATGKGREGEYYYRIQDLVAAKQKNCGNPFGSKKRVGKNMRWWREVCHILIFDKNTSQRKMFACLSFKYKLIYFF